MSFYEFRSAEHWCKTKKILRYSYGFRDFQTFSIPSLLFSSYFLIQGDLMCINFLAHLTKSRRVSFLSRNTLSRWQLLIIEPILSKRKYICWLVPCSRFFWKYYALSAVKSVFAVWPINLMLQILVPRYDFDILICRINLFFCRLKTRILLPSRGILVGNQPFCI